MELNLSQKQTQTLSPQMMQSMEILQMGSQELLEYIEEAVQENPVLEPEESYDKQDEFSTLQRCASHLASRTDITEAYQVGGAAAKAAFEGHTGEMVALKRISNAPYQCTTELHPISEVANLEKKVPLEWINADHTDMMPEFLAYAMPLIQAELTPIYINGTPQHIHLAEE